MDMEPAEVEQRIAWGYSIDEDIYLMFVLDGYVRVSPKAIARGIGKGLNSQQIGAAVFEKLLSSGIPLQRNTSVPADAVPVLLGGMVA